MKTRAHLIAALLAGGVLGVAAGGCPSSVAAQGMTQEQATAILNELRQIRLLLQQNQRPTGPPQAVAPTAPEQKVRLASTEAFELGRKDAPITLVEFTDYECPFCRRFHVSTFEQLKREFVETGKLRFVSRDLPLPIHQHAMGAALAARCAGEQGKYWEMRHVMIVNANRLAADARETYARELGLNMAGFQACVQGEKHEAAIRRDISDAQAVGISGTPTFVLGKTSPDGMEGVKIVGAVPYEIFAARIRALLGE